MEKIRSYHLKQFLIYTMLNHNQAKYYMMKMTITSQFH